MGKVKGKLSLFFAIVTVDGAFAHPQNIPNYEREISIIFESDKTAMAAAG
jgi:hypothetical protein